MTKKKTEIAFNYVLIRTWGCMNEEKLPDYTLEAPVYEHNSTVFPGVREKDGMKVVVKKVNKEAAKHEATVLAHLRNYAQKGTSTNSTSSTSSTRSAIHPGAFHISPLVEVIEVEHEQKYSYLVFPRLQPCEVSTASPSGILMWMFQILQVPPESTFTHF